jgi:hypothetical protein
MTGAVFRREAGEKFYTSPSKKLVDIVGGDVGGEVTVEEVTALKDAGLLVVRPTVRTVRMVAEFIHWRHSHVFELRDGALPFLALIRQVAGLERKVDGLEFSLSFSEDRELREYRRQATYTSSLEKKVAVLGKKLGKAEKELAVWAPSFYMGDVPMWIISQAGEMKGERPERGGVSTQRAAEYLGKKATYRPQEGEAVRGFYCHSSKRVAWILASGEVVVDDFGPSLAVHILGCEDLGKAIVAKAITIVEAKKSQHHLARIPHNDGYEVEVKKVLAAIAA